MSTYAHYELSHDGPIAPHLLATPATRLAAERGRLATLERMLGDYIDQADRSERSLAEATTAAAEHHHRQWLDASIRNIRWVLEAVTVQRRHMGIAAHPIIAAMQKGV